MSGTVPGPAALAPRALSLSQVERDKHLTPVQIDTLRDSALRREMVRYVIAFFTVINVVVIGLVAAGFAVDTLLVVRHVIPADQRVVTSTTLAALIAGSTAQLGVIAVLAGRSVFGAGGD